MILAYLVIARAQVWFASEVIVLRFRVMLSNLLPVKAANHSAHSSIRTRKAAVAASSCRARMGSISQRLPNSLYNLATLLLSGRAAPIPKSGRRAVRGLGQLDPNCPETGPLAERA